MRYLPHTPRNFREIVLADLLRAQRLILRVQDEIDPQFRIASPEGDWWIGITLADDVGERKRQMSLVSRFMQLKLSAAFTMASELVQPDAVYCVGISHRECYGVMSVITRNPISFGPEQWLTREQLGDEIPTCCREALHHLMPAQSLNCKTGSGPMENFRRSRLGMSEKGTRAVQ